MIFHPFRQVFKGWVSVLMAAMVAYYLNLRKQSVGRTGQAGAATSLGGLASGLLGIGCAACGTFVLGPVLSLVGAGGLIALLPFDGREFGLLGVGILVLSIVLGARKIQEPLVCPLEANSGAAQAEGLRL